MSDKKLLTLREMRTGQSGKVVELQGGQRLVNRLSALGIRPGKEITKVSSMIMRGPVTIQSGQTRLAIGFGMAGKIIVESEG
ncbi:ferrous iron transport protein A [Chloroflexota bacterium]